MGQNQRLPWKYIFANQDIEHEYNIYIYIYYIVNVGCLKPHCPHVCILVSGKEFSWAASQHGLAQFIGKILKKCQKPYHYPLLAFNDMYISCENLNHCIKPVQIATQLPTKPATAMRGHRLPMGHRRSKLVVIVLALHPSGTPKQRK